MSTTLLSGLEELSLPLKGVIVHLLGLDLRHLLSIGSRSLISIARNLRLLEI